MCSTLGPAPQDAGLLCRRQVGLDTAVSPEMVAIQIAAVPADAAAVPGGRITHAHGDGVVVEPPVRHTVDPCRADRVAVDEVVAHVLAALLGCPAVPHVVPGTAVDVHAGENVPQAGNVVAVHRLARIGHHPFRIPVLAELPLVGPGAPLRLRRVVEHAGAAVGLVVAVRLDPEDVDVVDPGTVIAALIAVADVGFPAVGAGAVEGAREPASAQLAVE